ncbi:MAG: heavy metal-associated domain-containing protein [Planctomycetota bacterium]
MKKAPILAAFVAAFVAAFTVAIWPSDSDDDQASTPQAASADLALTPVSTDGEMTLDVPKMHCQFACFPKVKKALEGSPEVESVALVPQEDEMVLTRRAVVVTYKKGFDPAAAIATLTKAGFPDSSVASEDG